MAFVILATTFSLVSASAPSAGSISFSLKVPHGTYYALRFNVSPGNDVQGDRAWTGCRSYDESTLGVEVGAIGDGRWSDGLLVAGYGGWNPFSDSFEVAAQGTVVRQPSTPPPSSLVTVNTPCDSNNLSFYGYAFSHSITAIAVSMAPVGWFNVSVNWTRGVDSYDLVVGNATVLTQNEFGQGIHGTAELGLIPPYEVSAGALVHKSMTTRHDAVGWFWPENPRGTTGRSVWACSHNGISCPPEQNRGEGLIDLSQKGHQAWSFDLTADAQLQVKYYMLGMVELPDDSYLS